MGALVDALREAERTGDDAISDLRRLASEQDDEGVSRLTEDEVYRLTRKVDLCVRLVGVLRRLCGDYTTDGIYKAFGAPGDFGYETLIGDALYRVYRGEAPP